MADYYKDFNEPNPNENYNPNQEQSNDDNRHANRESSYEWNAGNTGGEYRHSYINGNNQNAAHNPNNYDRAYSDTPSDYSYSGAGSEEPAPSAYNGAYHAEDFQSTQTQAEPPHASKRRSKAKKESKPASKKFVAAAIAITMIGSTALGFGGGMLASSMSGGNGNATTSTSADGNLKINQVDSGNSAKKVDSSSSNSVTTTSDIVKKTADSVVEIATEQTKTGTFARQYVQKGAGSGVIISNEDGVGYIVTNQHVIDGAENVTVTLRDGTTTYPAEIVGSDKDADVALIKIKADNLATANFGDSSTLAVGDYVVAIGNPLGTLGGTVTDGIISALAREVTIEDRNMTLLQTNAQISPGNSGGGLFNANGELIGIVNAKDSATEVEGIAFAIPSNKVIDVIKDLKDYGYVKGKISLGLEVESVSNETAFYYGINGSGCYVISVNNNSNAQKAGIMRGDLITKVNGTEISSKSDIDKALKDAKVGDKVTLTVTRSGQTSEISYALEEYSPSAQPENKNSDTIKEYQQDNDLWSRLFNW